MPDKQLRRIVCRQAAGCQRLVITLSDTGGEDQARPEQFESMAAQGGHGLDSGTQFALCPIACHAFAVRLLAAILAAGRRSYRI